MTRRRGPKRTTPPRRYATAGTVAASVAVVAIVAVVLATRNGSTGTSDQGSSKAIGSPAPEVHLPATNGQTITLTDYRGKRDVLIYFYEHAG